MSATCTYCGGVVDLQPGQHYQRTVGWERKSQAASRKSGSDIVLREQRDEFACSTCIFRLQHGLAAEQESLL
jgi:hypothetical protein